jgi:hypothetical protein
MPFALAIIGIIILVSAIRGTSGALFSTLKSDFTGSGNFLYWVIAILVVGSIGYIKKLQPISSAFLALLLVVLFISNKGFFAQFQSGISGAAATGCTTASTPNTTYGSGGAAAVSNNVLATPGQSTGTAINNMWQNLGSALNSGAYFGAD